MKMRRYSARAFGHRLRVLRIALGLSEKEISEIAGCTPASWRNWEATGKMRGNRPMLRVAKKFEVSLDWLIDGEGHNIKDHLSRRTPGSVAILPVKGPRTRYGERYWRERATRDNPQPA